MQGPKFRKNIELFLSIITFTYEIFLFITQQLICHYDIFKHTKIKNSILCQRLTTITLQQNYWYSIVANTLKLF